MNVIFEVIIITVIVIGSVFLYYGIIIPRDIERFKSLGEVCDGLTPVNSGEYDCCLDCKHLKLEYFKYEYSSSFFTADIKNCYCNENDKVIHVW